MDEAQSYLQQLGAAVDEEPSGVGSGDGGAPASAAKVDRRAGPELAGEPEPLFNDQDPLYTIKHERPEHRIIIFLKAQGLSNREIAERSGFTPTMIGYTLKQPWARRRLLREIETTGRDGVHELLKGSVEDSVLTLIDVQNDEKAKASDRMAAANSILDRFFGRPTQKVETTNLNIKATADDVRQLEEQLVEVDKEMQRLTGAPAKN